MGRTSLLSARKTIDFTVAVGAHATFTTSNRAGFGTCSPLALFVGFLGAGPFYPTLARDPATDRG